MGRRRGVMSESLKYELAKDLGFYDVVQREGWEGIRAKDAGNMVKRAIQIAQEQLVKQYTPSAPVSSNQTMYTQSADYRNANYAPQSTLNYTQTGYGSNANVRPSGGYAPSIYTANTLPNSQPPGSFINESFARTQQAGQNEHRPH